MSIEDEIYEASKKNFMLLGSNREIRRLPSYLNSGERVLALVTGTPHETVSTGYNRGRSYEKRAGAKKGRGIVVATDSRILFIKDGWLFRSTQDYPYETISSVEFETRIFFGDLSIYGKGDGTVYSGVGRTAGAEFSKIVRQLVADQKRGVSTATASIAFVDPSGLSEGEARGRLASLEESFKFGYISEQQYREHRALLVQALPPA